MKRLTVNFAIAALLATLSIPSFAQDVKEKEKETKDTKKEVEQITIVRKSDSKDKTVIEINGDKITVNGKPIEDLKDGDITVHRNKYKTMEGLNAYGLQKGRAGNFNWDSGDEFKMFDVDENRAMLGVVTEEVEGGVKVTELTDESAAKKAGIKVGDIITKIGDTKIEDPDQLSETVRKHKPGEKITITVLRDKKEQKITTELGKWKGVSSYSFTPGQNFKMEMPDYNELLAPRVQATPRMRYGQAWSSGAPRLGLSVQDTDDGKGVKVIDVDDESNAAKAGLKENDIITNFNGTEVNSADEVAKLVKENKDKPTINLKIKRDGKAQSIEVKMPRKLKTADL
jgi:serine protease Do